MGKIRINLWIEREQREGLSKVKERDGVSESEQIRRAIDLWLHNKARAGGAVRRRAAIAKVRAQ